MVLAVGTAVEIEIPKQPKSSITKALTKSQGRWFHGSMLPYTVREEILFKNLEIRLDGVASIGSLLWITE